MPPTVSSLALLVPRPRLTLSPMASVIERMCTGDEGALNSLIERTIPGLMRLARSITRNPSDADDVVASVYKRAWANAAQYDAERGSVYAWLHAMCRSVALDALRHRKSHDPQRITFAEDAYWGHAPGPHACAESEQFRRVLHLAIGGMPSLSQQLIAMAFFRDLSHAEIAAISGIPLGTVKSQLRRALLRLRRSLESAGTIPLGDRYPSA